MASHNDHDNQIVENNGAESETAPKSEQETALAACNKERDDWKDRCLRLAAEFENFKKRAEKDKTIWIQTTQTQMLKSVIDIVDDFDRAFNAPVGKDQDENIKQWISGFTFIHQAFNKFLAQYGVEEMKDYTNFDPSKHEALMQVESPDHASGTIVQVLQKGYLFKGQVLRPAKVSVAK